MSMHERQFQDFETVSLYHQEETILEFTEQLVEVMQAKNIRRSDLAKRLGKSKPYISQILQGSSNFSLRTAATLAVAVGKRLRLRLESESVAEEQPLMRYQSTVSTGSATDEVVVLSDYRNARWSLRTPPSQTSFEDVQLG